MHLVPEPTDVQHDLVGYHIQKHGWALRQVMGGSDGTPGWCYTVGLHQTLGHPELIIFGMPPGVASAVNLVCKEISNGRKLEVDVPTDAFFVGTTAALRPVLTRWYPPFVPLTTWFYADEWPPIWQIFWRDTTGLLPWEKGCERWTRQRQPLLFREKVRSARLTAMLRSLQWPPEDYGLPPRPPRRGP